MALQGTIKDFGIADIFQLIGQQQKTGVLYLRNGPGNSAVDVFFTKGRIRRAAPHGVSADAALCNALVRGGLITRRGADEASSSAREQLRQLRDVLVDSGLIVNEQVSAVEKLDTLENIYELFGWQDAEFEFQQKEIEVNTDSFEAIPAEHVLMDGFRMVDEWPAILREMPDFAQGVARTPGIEPPPPTEGGKGGGITHEEHRVYEQVEAGRTVQQVIDMARLGKFDGAKSLLSLLKKGYVQIEVRAEPDFLAPAIPAKRKRTWTGRGPAYLLLALLAVSVFAGLGNLYHLVTWPFWSRALRESERKHLHEARVIHALEAWYALESAYPASLDELLRVGLIDPQTVTFISGRADYQPAGDTFSLTEQKPDNRAGSSP
ncbi:MAG: DUF4388 domain-containing protein [Deltaproteobacteria bacterium]|nr:DUF4388 domain-containing protein [Deltaproteobacteria bacterium]